MSGERSGDREVMDRLVRDSVNEGVRHDKAKEMARKAMIEADRKARELGRR